MAKVYKTPGVYVQEIDTSPNNIVPVPTSIPAFIGYTEKSASKQQSTQLEAAKISTWKEYETNFGGPQKGSQTENPRFTLPQQIKLFFDNGGTTCYVVSVGLQAEVEAIKAADLIGGLEALKEEAEPSLLVIPEAVNLVVERDEDGQPLKTSVMSIYLIHRAMLDHCGQQQNCFAILDVWMDLAYYEESDYDLNRDINWFREGIGDQYLSYGAAYYPWLVVPDAAGNTQLLSPSGSMAGIYAKVDHNRGVFKAPANISPADASQVAIAIDNQEQEDMTVPIDGKAVNALRYFDGRGILVWGARTLDGNSMDYRYINIRRTLIYLEQSIKRALEVYIFEANNHTTWTRVKGMVNQFLNTIWQQGGLVGATPDQAYNVKIGLGSTMTPQDILDSRMRVQVAIAMVRPAEFIVLNFDQKIASA